MQKCRRHEDDKNKKANLKPKKKEKQEVTRAGKGKRVRENDKSSLAPL